MKIDITPYTVEDAYFLFDKGVKEDGLLLSSLGDWEAAAKRWEVAGPAYTLFINAEPIACGGIALIDSTMGECWVLISRTKHRIMVCRAIIRQLRELIDIYRFRRLQALVRTDFEMGVALATRLGFSREGTLRKYGPDGSDYHMYARTF